MSRNETSKSLLKGCLNPRGENVNISKVFIGCSISKNKSTKQTATGIIGNPKGRDYSRLSKLQHKIECALKGRYNEITLPSLPWLEMFDIPIEKYTTLQLESENERRMSKIIDLNNLFDNIRSTPDNIRDVPGNTRISPCNIRGNPGSTRGNPGSTKSNLRKVMNNPGNNRSSPGNISSLPDNFYKLTRKRILIESQPGFGKTTLAHKIVSDWSRGSEYVKHFKFAILIILREYMASTLKEELKDVIGVENCDNDDFWSVVNTEQTLLILDGLDEISGSLRLYIQEILHDTKSEYKMTIITTCRVGLSELNRRDIKSMHRGLSLKTDIWNKKITILGINAENQSEFIEKFVDENDKESLMPRLSKIIDTRKVLFNSPLLLILLVYVTSENHDVKINTDTDLYKALVDCITRRSIDKKNPKISSVDFTLFASSYSESIFDDCKKQFVKFGEICLDHILNDDLQFGSDTENEAIHQLGFLIKHVTKKCFGTIIRYEGFHLSILEFAAAVYMDQDFAMNDNTFRSENIDKFFKIVYNKKLASTVLPFLCDLLGKSIAHLIDDLSRYYVFFWFNAEIVEFLFDKCLMNNVSGEHFVKIIPPYFTVHTFRSLFAINNQYLTKFLVFALDDVYYLREISRPIRLRGLVCNGIDDEYEDVADILDIARNIACDSLNLTIHNGLPYENMANCFKIFRRVSSDSKNLCIRNKYRNRRTDFENCITNGILVGENLNTVIIELGNIEKEVIAKLIECNNIENLVLFDNMFMSSSKQLAATISHLTTTINCTNSLFVTCGRFCLGWDDFTKSGDKCLSESSNANENLEDTTSGTDSNTLDHKAREIFPLKPSRLYCRCCDFESTNNWNYWDTIVELTLTDVANSSQTYQPDFSKFKSLKILTLVISYGSELNEANVENIIKSIKGLNLSRLKIKWFSSHYEFYGSIIDGIRDLLQNKAFFCSESIRFEIITIEVRPELFDFEIIKSALLSDPKIVFCIASNNWPDLQKIVMIRMNDLLLYNIKYSYIPYTIDNNPLYVEYGFNCNTDVQHMLELTLC